MKKLKKSNSWGYGISIVLTLSLVSVSAANAITNNFTTDPMSFFRGETHWGQRKIEDVPIVEEELLCSDLLQSVERVTITTVHESGTMNSPEMDIDIQRLISGGVNQEQFGELLSIFAKYTFSPIDYEKYVTGGGLNFENNDFMTSPYFLFDLTNDDFDKQYNFHWFDMRFSISELEEIQIQLYENGNVVITSTTILPEQFHTTDGSDVKVNYSLPYSLDEANRSLFQDLTDFIANNNFEDVLGMEYHNWE